MAAMAMQYEVAGHISRAVRLFADVVNEIERHRMAAKTRKSLEGLTDLQLEDIGISRADIHRMG